MRFRPMSVLIAIAAFSAGIFPVTMIATASQPHTTTVAKKVPVGTVGRVNPAQPIKMTVINNTSAELYAGISGGRRVRLAPRNRYTFTFNSTPINVFVYPARNKSGLKYNTSVQGNNVTVRVTRVGGVTPGDGSININRSGAVYVF